MKDVLGFLSNWYAARCDGDWEHQYGVRIDTLDNPGWSVKIDLTGTPLAGREFVDVRIDRAETDWIQCRVVDARFEGFGGLCNLPELLSVFRDWVARG